MRCFNCHADIPDDSRFCPECGAMQANAPVQPQTAAEDILAGIQLEDEPVSTPAAPQQPAAPQYQAPANSDAPPAGSDSGYSYSQPASSYTPPANSYTQPASSYTPPASSYTPPENSYSQPASSYTPPENSYTQPAGGYAPVPPTNTWQPGAAAPTAAAAYQAAQPLKAEKKKSKKGLIIGLCAGGVVIAALVAVLLLFTGKPLQRALKGTSDDLNAMLSAGNLGTITKNLDKLQEKSTTTMNATVSGIEGLEASLNYEINADTKVPMTDGTLDFSLNMGGESSGGTVRMAADQDALQFAIDGVDGTYGVRYANLLKLAGEEAPESLELDNEKLTLKALQNGPMNPIFDSLKDEEVGQTRITSDGGDKICKHFVVTWDEAAVEQVAKELKLDEDDEMGGLTGLLKDGKLSTVNSVSGLLTMALRELKPSIDIYTCNNRVIGVDVHAKNSDETVFLRLLGAKNVFEHVRVSTSSDDGFVDLNWEKAGTLRLSANFDGETMDVLTYDDKTGSIKLAEELLDDPTVSGTLKPTDKGAVLSLDLAGDSLEGGKVSVSCEIAPLKNAPKQLADSFTDLTEASEEELDGLLSGAMDKLGLAGLAGLTGGLGGDIEDWNIDDGDDWGLDDGDDWNVDDGDIDDIGDIGDIDDIDDWNLDDGDDDNWTSEDGNLAGYTGDLTMDDVWGSYDFAYIEAYGMQFTAEDLEMPVDENYFTLWSDGTGIFVWEGDSAKLNWSLEGNVIHLTDRDSDEEIFDVIYTQDGSLAIEAEDGYLVFTRDID